MADFSQRVIWTALPTGVDGNFVTLTALVSPRLNCKNRPRAPLEKWPDFLNWPEHAVHARYSVSFAGVTAEAERISTPDSTIWQALFGNGTGVYNHAFKDRRTTAILSYPMAEVHDFICKTYTELGVAAQDELPNKQDIFQEIGQLARKEYQDDITFQANALSRLRQGIEGRHYFAGTQGAFTLQELYHMPLAAPDYDLGRHIKRDADDPRENAHWRQHRFYEMPDPDDLAELIDFHQIVSALNQYPYIMRLAGLAVDLRLPKDTIAAGPISGPLTLEVDWKPTPETGSGVATVDDVYPRTMTEWHAPIFEPIKRHASTPLSHGMLVLEDQKRFRLMQLDVDGAGIKVRNTARSYLRSRRPVGDERPDPGGIATIRTVGLQLVEVDRHVSLAQAFDNSGAMQDALEADAPIDLFAEDLIRGYHSDIFDETRGNGWQSLCRRDGTYTFLNTAATIKTEDEEGMIRLAAQEAIDETDPTFKDVAKISEQIFAWTGWSLTAPRIGLAIDTKDKPDTTHNTAPPDLPLEVNFHVRAGSLPALRFGHTYRVRVRVADLAGNARALRPGDAAISSGASPAQVFRRYEPVPVPVNALVQKEGNVEAPSDGEAMSRPAIRSYNADPADNTVPTKEAARRHVVPPRSSHSMAEMHGAIDTSPGRPNPALYTLLAGKDGNLPEVKVLHEDPLTASSDLVPYAAAGETFALPYLPDVLARAAVVRLDFDPATEPAKRFEIPYYGSGASWPNAQAFKVRIFEDSSAAITFDSATRTLNVPLAKAEVMRVRISHALKEDDLQLLALWHMMKAHARMTGQLEARLRTLVLSGGHWMITPWLDMELVHAVQKPLVKPAFLALAVNRKFGETAADITFRSPIHAKSTDKTELMGRWREPSDEPNEGPPRVINRSASAFETRLSRSSAPSGTMSGSGRHAFDDTRFRRVRYRLEAPTRFKEFMPSAIRQNPGAMTVVSDPHDAFVENSAIPPVPEVVEVVPTFGWTRTTNRKRASSFRSGGGLRIWLKRPWFSTGFGEMLGVLVADPATPRADLTDKLAKFVSQWGADPIWRSGGIAAPSPPVSAFSQRIMGGPIPEDRSPEFVPEEERALPAPFPSVTNLVVPESHGARVSVVPHGVLFDAKRNLYYADIVVKPGSSYFPFIRLALARFHPVSSPGAHLSPAVMVNWMQLTPDRLLVMTEGSRSNERKLQLFGHIYTRSALQEEPGGGIAGPVIQVELQVRDGSKKDELDWQRFDRALPAPIERFMATLDPERAPKLVSEANDVLRVATPMLAPDLKIFATLRPPLMWERTITLPRRRAGEELRVMVCEYEKHAVDSDRSKRPEGAPDPSLRLVYAETFAL